MQKNLEKVVLKDRENRMRIRSIMKHLKSLSINDGQLNLVILEEIVAYLNKNNLPYSKREIYSAFKLVPKNEYDQSYKNKIINELSRDGKNGSVFTSKQPSVGPEIDTTGRSYAFAVPSYTQKQTRVKYGPKYLCRVAI